MVCRFEYMVCGYEAQRKLARLVKRWEYYYRKNRIITEEYARKTAAKSYKRFKIELLKVPKEDMPDFSFIDKIRQFVAACKLDAGKEYGFLGVYSFLPLSEKVFSKWNHLNSSCIIWDPTTTIISACSKAFGWFGCNGVFRTKHDCDAYFILVFGEAGSLRKLAV